MVDIAAPCTDECKLTIASIAFITCSDARVWWLSDISKDILTVYFLLDYHGAYLSIPVCGAYDLTVVFVHRIIAASIPLNEHERAQAVA